LRGNFREKTGRVILAGGEILLDPVREPVLYPAIDLLHEKYRDRGGVKVIVQTTAPLRVDGDALFRQRTRRLGH
jgi:hypothetical protein